MNEAEQDISAGK